MTKSYAVYVKEVGSGKRFRPLAVGEGPVTKLMHATVFTEYMEAVSIASEYTYDNRGHNFEVREVK